MLAELRRDAEDLVGCVASSPYYCSLPRELFFFLAIFYYPLCKYRLFRGQGIGGGRGGLPLGTGTEGVGAMKICVGTKDSLGWKRLGGSGMGGLRIGG